jgi:spore germination protein KA
MRPRQPKNDNPERPEPEKTQNMDKIPLNTRNLKELLEINSDVVFRELLIGEKNQIPVTLVFFDGLVDIKQVDDDILRPLLLSAHQYSLDDVRSLLDKIENGMLYHAFQKIRESLSDCVKDILDGSVALVFDQVEKAVTLEVKGFEKRSVSEPTGENIIKGAKDAFIENIRTNTATIRRKIRTQSLVIEHTKVGRQTHTEIAIVYMRNITNKHMIEEVKNKLDKINADGVHELGVIEESITDNKNTTFPLLLYTVRPDKFCANIVEGRVGLLIDGFPISYIIPGTLDTFLQAPEDYSQNYIISSIVRVMRYVLAFVTLYLPGFYVSITTFHHEMIPTELALAITASKEGVPFPSFVEVIFMLIAFEVLVEAGIRLPKAIGQAVSIVGAVVVGQAAVDAKLVSPAVIVIIAITAISSFTMPNQDLSNALRLWRFVFVLISSVIGLFGLSLAAIVLLNHLAAIETFGVPYLTPYVGQEGRQLQDSLFRFPFSSHKTRPLYLKTKNKKRIG